MRKLAGFFTLALAAFAVLLLALKVKAQGGLTGTGPAAGCIQWYETTDNGFGSKYEHFKNGMCNYNVNVTVMSPQSNWSSFLSPNNEVVYSKSSGPFRYVACAAPQHPINPSYNNWPQIGCQ